MLKPQPEAFTKSGAILGFFAYLILAVIIAMVFL